MTNNGARALEHGLGPLPDVILPATTFPLAYWKSATFAAVVSLCYAPDLNDGINYPQSWHTRYERVDGEWCSFGGADGTGGPNGWRGAVGPPGSIPAPEGKCIWLGMHSTTSQTEGHPAHIVAGWHTSEVAHVSLAQKSGTEQCEAKGHYGAWIIGTERDEPWTVEAYDSSGQLLGSIDGPRPQETPLEVIPVSQVDQIHSSGGQMRVLAVDRYENKVAVNWEFTFHPDSALTLPADNEAEVQDKVRAKSFESLAARDESGEEWRRRMFVLGLTIADDLGTEYEQVGGGGSSSGVTAKWTSTFRPALPQAASLLSIHHGEMVVHVPLQ